MKTIRTGIFKHEHPLICKSIQWSHITDKNLASMLEQPLYCDDVKLGAAIEVIKRQAKIIKKLERKVQHLDLVTGADKI